VSVAKLADVRGAHIGVCGQFRARQTLRLPRACGLDARPDGCQRFAPPLVGQLLKGHARHLDEDVDAVEQRGGEAFLVAADEGHRAGAIMYLDTMGKHPVALC